MFTPVLAKVDVGAVLNTQFYPIEGAAEVGGNRFGCLVNYAGTQFNGATEIIARVSEQLPRNHSHLKIKYPNYLFGDFITSKVPKGFTQHSLEDIAFLGYWEQEMKQGKQVPDFQMVHRFYDPGIVIKLLYFCEEKESLVPYTITKASSQKEKNGSGDHSVVNKVLRHYLIDEFSIPQYQNKPRVILIDHSISLPNKKLIVDSIRETETSDRTTNFKPLLMEPMY